MHEHDSSPLQGPVRGSRAWWRLTAPAKLASNARLESPAQSRQGIRVDLVARIRKEIAAGSYDTPEKWEAALNRLLNQLGG